MPDLKKITFLIAFSFMMMSSFAQQMNHDKEEPTDFMNRNGKIYVVLTVVVIIVFGLFLYLVSLERKMKKLEKNLKEDKP